MPEEKPSLDIPVPGDVPPDKPPEASGSLDIPVPGKPQKEGTEMAMDATIGGSLEAVVLSQAQGHAFVMEAGRIGMLEGKVGYREGLTHRIIGESG